MLKIQKIVQNLSKQNLKHLVPLLLLIVVLLTVFFRLWQINLVPPGLYPDEAMNANNALTSLESQEFQLFYPENNGREGLFVWLIGLSFALFGPSIWALRLVSALIGIFTVVGLYYMTYQLFLWNGRKYYQWAQVIALLSSFFAAISFWLVNFSRIGFRGILVPFCLVWAFYFLFKGINKKRWTGFALAGLFFGLGFYTYIAFRVAVLMLALVGLIELWHYYKYRRPKKLTWKNIWKKVYLKDGWWRWDLLLIVLILIALPIGLYFYQNPGDFMGRTSGVSVTSAENPLQALADSSLKTIGMFNVAGDWNWRHNLSGSPMLLWPVGVLFVIGLLLTIAKAITDKKSHRIYLFLLAWFGTMLLPAVLLSSEGLPHALRSIGVIPVVYIIAALGGVWFFHQMQKAFKNKNVTVFLTVIFLIALTGAQYNKYFNTWGQNQSTADAFRQDLVDLGCYLNTLDDQTKKFVLVNQDAVRVPDKDGLPMPSQTVVFVTRADEIKEIKYLSPENIDQVLNKKHILLPSSPKGIFIPVKEDMNLLKKLNLIIFNSQLKQEQSFWLLQVN